MRRVHSSEQVNLIVCNAAHVLHRSKVVLGHENLVVLAKWILLAKKVFVKSHANFGHLEHFLVVDIALE